MIDDHLLQAQVMEELEWEPSIDAAHIGVAAKGGVVTLSGFVSSFAQKVAAERAASRVQGVQAIAEESTVRLPQSRKEADAEIAERAVRILAWDIEVPEQRIQIKVEHGVVTLTGEVPFRFQREAAETAVRKLGGVVQVNNLIGVVPARDPELDVDLVCTRIENALRRSAELEASGIRVTVDDSRVTLEGIVRTWAERRIAQDAAWAAPGVIEVANRLVVSP